MKIEIENYKGQSISYNDVSDKFECEIELNNDVKNAKRASLNDVRKDIDLFIKKNLEFKPFKILLKNKYGRADFITQICTAIRTDGKFVVGNGDRQSYLDRKDMKFAMYYDLEIVKEKERLDKELADANLKYKEGMAELFNKLTPCDLSQYSVFMNPEGN